MSRKQQRIKRKIKRKEETAKRVALVEKINSIIRPNGCWVIGLGPSAVGVQGDSRSYGVSVVIRFPENVSSEQIGDISNEVTNKVREVTRVLMDIPLESA